MSRPWFMLA